MRFNINNRQRNFGNSSERGFVAQMLQAISRLLALFTERLKPFVPRAWSSPDIARHTAYATWYAIPEGILGLVRKCLRTLPDTSTNVPSLGTDRARGSSLIPG